MQHFQAQLSFAWTAVLRSTANCVAVPTLKAEKSKFWEQNPLLLANVSKYDHFEISFQLWNKFNGFVFEATIPLGILSKNPRRILRKKASIIHRFFCLIVIYLESLFIKLSGQEGLWPSNRIYCVESNGCHGWMLIQTIANHTTSFNHSIDLNSISLNM